MSVKKWEIAIILLSALAILTAVGIFLYRLQEKKLTKETELYSCVASSPYSIVSINNPVVFKDEMLSRKPIRELFASSIPPVFLSIIQHAHAPLLLSFHKQGVILYLKTDAFSANRLTETVIKNSLNAFAPQQQKKGDIVFSYYPDTNNRFLGCYYHNHVWVASYSKKLLEEVARIQNDENPNEAFQQKSAIPQSLDPNVPIHIMIRNDIFNLHLTLADSTEWRPSNKWIGMDVFINDNQLNYLSILDSNITLADSLQQDLDSIFASKIGQTFSQFQISHQITQENGTFLLTGVLQPSAKQ